MNANIFISLQPDCRLRRIWPVGPESPHGACLPVPVACVPRARLAASLASSAASVSNAMHRRQLQRGTAYPSIADRHTPVTGGKALLCQVCYLVGPEQG